MLCYSTGGKTGPARRLEAFSSICRSGESLTQFLNVSKRMQPHNNLLVTMPDYKHQRLYFMAGLCSMFVVITTHTNACNRKPHTLRNIYLHKQGAMVGVGGKRYGMSPLDRSDCIEEIWCHSCDKGQHSDTSHKSGHSPMHRSKPPFRAASTSASPPRVVAEYSGAYLCSHTSNCENR